MDSQLSLTYVNTFPYENGRLLLPYQPQEKTKAKPKPDLIMKENTFANKLAISAREVAEELNSKGWCKKGVRLAMEKLGLGLKGKSAYMAADQLANNPHFIEVEVSRWQLKKLQPGHIVVWDKCLGHKHGHVSIALGNGIEASDCLRKQFTLYGPRYRVFQPVEDGKMTMVA